jgi:hypothetical protein
MKLNKKGEIMFIAKVVFKEAGKTQRLEVKLDNAHKLLELVSKFEELDLIEVHLFKEVV